MINIGILNVKLINFYLLPKKLSTIVVYSSNQLGLLHEVLDTITFRSALEICTNCWLIATRHQPYSTLLGHTLIKYTNIYTYHKNIMEKYKESDRIFRLDC
jgi:hypothetical protein